MISSRKLIRRFDDWLSQLEGIRLISDDPQLIMRIQVGRASWTIPLPERTIQKGSPLLFAHLWNERMPLIPAQGPDLSWALETKRRMIYSFEAIAGIISRTSSMQNIQGVGGVLAHINLTGADGGRIMLEHLGFTIYPYHRPLGAFGEFWENFFTWGLMWAYNPASLQRRSLLRLQRSEFWMAREPFLQRFEKSNEDIPIPIERD